MAREPRVSVSGFFDAEDKVERALLELTSTHGVPRDLVEVLVSRRASRRFYGARALALGSQSFRFGAAGAIIGMLFASLLSFELVLFPGRDLPGVLPLVQLLGPNMGLVLGALAGALVGLFVKKRPRGPYRRVLERDEILVVVHGRGASEARAIEEALERTGATAVRSG